MKKSYLTITFLVFAFYIFLQANFANAGAVFNKPPVTLGLISGLVGYWSFDGPDMGTTSAKDASGNNNTGWLVNGTKKTIGKIAQGLEFDGGNDNVVISHSTNFDQNHDLTISFWVKTATQGHQYIMGKYSGSGSNGWMLGSDSCWGSAGYISFYTDSVAGCIPTSALVPDIATNDGSWHHIAALVDRTAVIKSMYIDGRFAGSKSLATANINTSNLRLGEVNAGAKFFGGVMDEVRIYNRVLSVNEIKRLYKIGATAKFGISQSAGSLKDGLVGHWSFDGPDMAGVTAYDRSGQGNNGTLTNDPTRQIGKIGQALSFDGVNDAAVTQVSLGDIDLTTAYTLSAWVKSDGCGAYCRIVAKAWTANIDPWTTYALYANGTTGTTYQAAALVTVGGVDYAVVGTSDIPIGKWVYVTGTYDGETLCVYFNGVLENCNDSPSGSINTNNVTTYLAYNSLWNGSPSQHWRGSIDEVRMYNRALSADEIKRLYNMGR